MTDKPSDVLPISDRFNTKTEFVNQIVGSGYLNGVVNVTAATAQFTPRQDGTVDPDLVITSRLRMDLSCAKQLHEQLGRILEQNLQPANGTTH